MRDGVRKSVSEVHVHSIIVFAFQHRKVPLGTPDLKIRNLDSLNNKDCLGECSGVGRHVYSICEFFFLRNFAPLRSIFLKAWEQDPVLASVSAGFTLNGILCLI